MRFGYACINLSVYEGFTSCILRTAQQKGLPHIRNLTLWNLRKVVQIIKWNIERDMPLYRLSSDLVPFGSHPMLDGWDWWNDPLVIEICKEGRDLVKRNNQRITIHPGQFNNLSSPRKEVITSTTRDLVHQTRLLELFGGEDMILHLGGVHGNKKESNQRFVSHFKQLPQTIQANLRIENDDKSYNIADVFETCEKLGCIPMYDYHHDICLPSLSVSEIREGLVKYWRGKRMKFHLSSGKTSRRDNKHSDYISVETWKRFYNDFGDWDLDVMLEAKKKNLAVFDLKTKIRELGEIGNIIQ